MHTSKGRPQTTGHVHSNPVDNQQEPLDRDEPTNSTTYAAIAIGFLMESSVHLETRDPASTTGLPTSSEARSLYLLSVMMMAVLLLSFLMAVIWSLWMVACKPPISSFLRSMSMVFAAFNTNSRSVRLCVRAHHATPPSSAHGRIR